MTGAAGEGLARSIYTCRYGNSAKQAEIGRLGQESIPTGMESRSKGPRARVGLEFHTSRYGKSRQEPWARGWCSEGLPLRPCLLPGSRRLYGNKRLSQAPRRPAEPGGEGGGSRRGISRRRRWPPSWRIPQRQVAGWQVRRAAGAVGAYPAGADDSRFGIGYANPKRPAAASVRQHAQTATLSAVRRRGHAPRLATPVPAQAKWPWHVADGRTPKPSFGRRAAILARERPSYGTAT